LAPKNIHLFPAATDETGTTELEARVMTPLATEGAGEQTAEEVGTCAMMELEATAGTLVPMAEMEEEATGPIKEEEATGPIKEEEATGTELTTEEKAWGAATTVEVWKMRIGSRRE